MAIFFMQDSLRISSSSAESEEGSAIFPTSVVSIVDHQPVNFSLYDELQIVTVASSGMVFKLPAT